MNERKTASGRRSSPARVAAAVTAMLLACLGLARCSGCSAECQGTNARPENCPCSADVDCSTSTAILLCVDGACKPGNPTDAPGTPCASGGTCAAGQACGVDDICLAAPKCQRIEKALSYRLDANTTGDLTASLSDCDHHWSAGGQGATLDLNATIDLQGVIHASDNSGQGCTDGQWFAGQRAGFVRCGGTIWALSSADVLPHTCIGADCDACGGTVLGGGPVGLCP